MRDREFHATRYTRGAALLAAATLILASGCGTEPTAPKKNLVPLTLVSQPSGAGSLRAPAGSGSLTLAGAQNDTVNVTFSEAVLVVRDVRFILPEMEDAMNDQDSTASDDDGGAVIFRGPFVIDLLSHSAAALDTMMVPPGDYHHLQGHLQALHDGDAAATPEFAFLIGSTVHLEGTIEGEGGGPFTFHARIDNEFQIRGRFTVEEDTPATAFITFNPDLWLLDRDGHFLDPRNLDNLQAIKSAIRHSIKVGMDDDHDGEMDDDMFEVEE